MNRKRDWPLGVDWYTEAAAVEGGTLLAMVGENELWMYNAPSLVGREKARASVAPSVSDG